MTTMKIFLMLVLTSDVLCQHSTKDRDQFYPLIPEYMELLFLSFLLMLGTICRQVVIIYDIPTPYCIWLFIFAFIWGIFAYLNPVALQATSAIYMDPHQILYIYIPTIVFYIAFFLDNAILLKTLPQIVVIGVPVTLTSSFLFGAIMRLAIDTDWSIGGGFLFGVISSPIYPANIMYLLKKQSTRTKHIAVLLEGEALFSLILADLIHKLAITDILGFTAHWYQLVAIILRCILIGILTGYVLGLMGRYVVRKVYSNRLSVFLLSFTIPFYSYALSQLYFSGCGSITVAIVGAMMSVERAALSKEIEKFLSSLWEATAFTVEVIIGISCSMLFVIHYAKRLSWNDYVLALVTFLMYYSIRFIAYLLFSPAISRLGYGMDLKDMLICVWSGIKAPYSLILVRIFRDYGIQQHRTHQYYLHILSLYFFSNLINVWTTGTIMDFLGLRKTSLARQINMNNCMKHIFTKRDRMIAILKLDRFLVDTNWPLVIEATNMKHPYDLGANIEDEDVFFWGYHFTNCPDCKKEIQQEPTARELREMTREAKIRILKAKKMSYSRQFENGMMSKEGIRILSQTVELAMDSSDAVIQLDSLTKRFHEEDCITRCVRHRIHELKKPKGTSLRPPRKYSRRLCYNLVVNKVWEKLMLYVIAVNIVYYIVDLAHNDAIRNAKVRSFDNATDYITLILDISFGSFYLLECIMKIIAYSWLDVCKDGVRTYFRSWWNVIDFIVIWLIFGDLAWELTQIHKTFDDSTVTTVMQVLYVMVWLRIIRLFRLFELLYPKIIRYLDRNVYSQMAFTYELGKSYAAGQTEVLDQLPYMIDNKKVREEIKKKEDNDKVVITKLLGIVQKEKPWAAITVKTKQAIRTILKSMNEAINQLKMSGWVDAYEQEKLEAGMAELYKKVNAIKTVQPSAPNVIFKEVAWMAGEQTVIDFLFENITMKTFEPGDVVFGEGTVADGIYIVVTGLFMITYQPVTSVLDNLHEYGTLPIVDYLSSTKFEEAAVDYIVSGNCVGELSTLTKRAYNCTIVADAHTQVFGLSSKVLKKGMELSPDPVMGLECRIWKEVSIRIAVPLLLSVPAYQSSSQDQIKYTLERAFVPNLSNYKIFYVNEMIQDIILIEGLVADFNSRETFVAPCCIPRTVQKLILPNSSMMNLPITIETKLLIIPEKDLTEYDVMHMEETGEILASTSGTRCLQHAAQQRLKQRRRITIKEGTKEEKLSPKIGIQSPASSSVTMYFTNENTPSSPSLVMYEDEKIGVHYGEDDEDKNK